VPPARTVRGFGLADKLKDFGRGNVHKLRVYFADEEGYKDVAVADVRHFVARTIATVDSMPRWTRVEFLDKRDNITDVHKRCADDETAPTELEELHGGGATGDAARVQSMMSVCSQAIFRAQEVALSRHQAGMQQVLDAQARLIESQIRRNELFDSQNAELQRVNYALSAELAAEQLKLVRDLRNAGNANGGAEDEDGDESESGKVLRDIWPALLDRLLTGAPDEAKAAAREAVKRAGAKAATPKNGTNGMNDANGHAKAKAS
jgi:hypothetical protein